MRTKALTTVIIAAIIIAFGFLAIADTPHNASNNLNCGSCHWSAEFTDPSWNDLYDPICLNCHKASSGPYSEINAPLVKTHSSANTSNKYGEWTKECRNCHDPHNQKQKVYKDTDANNLYLATGTITSVVNNGDGTSTLAYSSITYKSGWNSTKLTDKTGKGGNDKRSTILFPTVSNLKYNYPITAVDTPTANTITVKGNATTGLTPPATFAVLYGQHIRDSINVSGTFKTVKFFDNEGAGSFGDGDGTYNGVCEICHTQTNHFRNATGASDQNHLNIGGAGAAGINCITCHPHKDGFKPNCNACHGYPPGFNGGQLVYIDKDGNSVASDSSGVGAHAKHYTVGFVCFNCHTGGMLGGVAQGDDLINIGFNLNSVNLDGTYDGKTGRTFFPYASGGATTVTANGSLECSNLYCHGSTMAPNGGSDITPIWDNPATGACGTCHGATAANPPIRGSHSMHAGSAGGGRQLECTACHSNYQTNHVNGSVNVQPGSGTNFTFPGDGTCSNISCHSNTDAGWGTSACLNCHSVSINNRAAIMSQFNANSHHVQAGGAVTSDKCYQCHWEANSDGTINGIYHGGSGASGLPVDLVIYGAGTRPTTYTLGTTAIQYTANGSRTEIQKINSHCISCHSDQNNAAQPFGDGKTPKQYAWDGTSVDAKYSQTGTTTWGKYTTTANAAKKDITKSYSAHGNAQNNYGGGWPDAPSGCSGVNITETICTEFGGTWDGACENMSASACTQNFCSDLTQGTCGIDGGTWTGTVCININASTCTTGYCSWMYDCGYYDEYGEWVPVTCIGKDSNTNQATCESLGRTWNAPGTWKTGGKWSSGVDYALNSTRGGVNAKNVACFDCHNSHGSSASGTTTSYASATTNGGILKDTVSGKGGYSTTYKTQSGGSAGNKNAYNPGAGLCFDCHMNAGSGITPWGYSSTFGALQPVMGYGDTPYFGPGTSGPQQRYPYKAGQGNMGGHFGVSSGLSTPPSENINGLCTPCHDPHGVSTTLGANQQYAVPLLKGTWMTSPYKEDVPPATNAVQILFSSEGLSYHIDQNTFGLNTRDAVSGISETDSKFAGLCLNCHSKSSLTDGTTHTWKSKDRIHESVKGWKTANGTIKHTYTCSKCHTPHNSSLPRLMTTNCLNSSHKGRVGYNNASVTSGSGGGYNTTPGDVACYGLSRYCPGYYERMDWGSGTGGGQMPGRYSAPNPPGNNFSVTCHESNAPDQSWNVVTPWVSHAPTAPTLIDERSVACASSCSITLDWNAVTDPDGHAVEYYVQIDDASDFSSPEYTSGWISGTNATTTALSTNKTYYWRVQARDASDLEESNWSNHDTFTLLLPAPPPAPTLIDEPDVVCASSCSKTLQWYAVSAPDGDSVEYYVQVDDASDFSSPEYTSGWISGTNATTSALPANKTYYWRVQARDAVHTTQISSWPSYDSFDLLQTPPAPTLIDEPDAVCASSCSVTLDWNVVTIPDGHAAEYYVQVDDASNFSSPNYTSGWISGTSWENAMGTATTWYWRVQARDAYADHTAAVSSWSGSDSFRLTTVSPPSAPTVINPGGYNYSSDCVNPSSVTLSWNAVTDPDGVEYYVEVNGYGSSGWITGTSWTISAGAQTTYSWHVKARNAVHTDAESQWSDLDNFGDVNSCGSCPMLYTWDGNMFAFESDLYSRGKLGLKYAIGFLKPIPHDYYLLLNTPVIRDGRYELKLVEERPEADYMDSLRLFTVDIPQDRDVYPEIVYSNQYVDPATRLHTVDRTLKHPLYIKHVNTGEDVSALLSSTDESYLVLSNDRNLDFEWHTLELDLGDLSQSPMIKMIIDAQSLFPASAAGSARARSLELPGGLRTKLEVLDANGNWVMVPVDKTTLPIPKEFRRPFVFDISNIFLNGTYKVRLSFLYKTYIDSISFDSTADEPVSINEIPLNTANLGYHGLSAKTRDAEIYGFIYDSVTGQSPEYLPGNYTRYGDVTSLLTQTDDMFVIFGSGDEVTLNFNNVADIPEGKTRRFLLYTNGYYKSRNNLNIARTVEPLPFSAMSNFPYDTAVENYPSDAAHEQYRLEYNTRAK